MAAWFEWFCLVGCDQPGISGSIHSGGWRDLVPVIRYIGSGNARGDQCCGLFTAGQAIPLASTSPPAASVTDFGSQIVVEGQPADNDTFSVSPSSSQSLFQTMQNLIGILRSPVGSTSYSTTEYTNALGGQLTNLDQAFGNISRVQASVGTRMRELDSLGDTSSDLEVQHKQTLSKLQDLDYAKAISEFTQQQVQLEAAQKSFAQVSGLSLFDYL